MVGSVEATAERTDGRSTSTARVLEVHSFLNRFKQTEDGAGFAWQLDPHGVAAFLVHDREELSFLAVQISSHIDGSQTAVLAEVILVLFEGEGAPGAACSVALKLDEDKLLVVVNIAHDEGTLGDVNGGGHSVGAAESRETPRGCLTGLFYSQVGEGVDEVLGRAEGRHGD